MLQKEGTDVVGGHSIPTSLPPNKEPSLKKHKARESRDSQL